MTGWVRIQRDSWDHPFFDREPMSEREAWHWMIANAAYKDTRHKVGAQMVDVPRGSFMATLRELQAAFMWGSDTKVRNFLKRLENEGMTERTTVGTRNAPKTHVTICNYDKFQSPERTENAPKTHRERTENAVKKQVNNKQDKDTNVSLVQSGFPKQVFQDFWDAYPHRNGKKKRPDAEKAFSKAIKGGATVEQIAQGVEAMRHDPDVQRGYARDPTTWLNQKGWTDEFDAKQQFKAITGGHNDKPASKSARRMEAFIAGATRARGS